MPKCLNRLDVWTSWKPLHREMLLIILSLRENGADFYGLPRNEGYVELRKEEWK